MPWGPRKMSHAYSGPLFTFSTSYQYVNMRFVTPAIAVFCYQKKWGHFREWSCPALAWALYCDPLMWPCHGHRGWHRCFTGAYGGSRISALDISGLSNWRGKGAPWDLSWGCLYYLYDFMFPCIHLEEKAWWIPATSAAIIWVQLGLQWSCRTNSGLQSTPGHPFLGFEISPQH